MDHSPRLMILEEPADKSEGTYVESDNASEVHEDEQLPLMGKRTDLMVDGEESHLTYRLMATKEKEEQFFHEVGKMTQSALTVAKFFRQ